MSVPALRFENFSGSWFEKKLCEIADIKTGPFGSTLHESDYAETGTPIITVEHLGEQGVVHNNLPLVSDEDKTRLKSYNLKQGDIVFSRVGSVDRSCLISDKENGWLFSGRLLRVRLSDINFCSIFLNQIFKNETVKYRIRSVAVGQTMASLNTEILKNFSLVFPSSKPEQTKIANFLTAVDEKITLLTQKHDLLTQYKKGVMQQIFSQELRFKDNDGQDFADWELSSLEDMEKESLLELGRGNVISKTDIDKIKGAFPIYSSSVRNYGLFGHYGLFMFDEELITWSIDGGGDFFYRKKHKFSVTNVSGFLRITSEKINCKFLSYQLIHLHKKLSFDYQTKAHPSVIRSLYVVQIPAVEEQVKIANFLSAIDDKITATLTQLQAVKQYKQGLLQQMFV